MSDVDVVEFVDAWPQVSVLTVSLVGFLWAAALVRHRWRVGLPAITPRPQSPVPWSGRDVMVIVLTYLLGATLLAEIGPEEKSLADRLLGTMALSLTATLAGMGWLRMHGATRADLGLTRPSWSDVRIALTGLALVVLPLLMLAAGLNAIVRYEHPIVDYLDRQRDGIAVALVVVSAVVVAPVAEEFFFRRVLQGWLERFLHGDARSAIAGSSLAFASAHAGQGLAFVPLFPLAVVLGVIAHRTGSIVPCVLLHGLFNAVSVLLLVADPAVRSAGAG